MVFRTGARARVHAAGPSAAIGRRYAREARLPFTVTQSEGLAAWTTTALPVAKAITIELPPGHLTPRTTARLAYALDRLAGTHFARTADQERRRLIARGKPPRR